MAQRFCLYLTLIEMGLIV